MKETGCDVVLGLGGGSIMDALETYLNENCNITVTAEKLLLHRNTLKYKIRKLEEMLNCDLHDFNDCMQVKIALNVGKMLK